MVASKDKITDSEKFYASQNSYKPGWYNLISLSPRHNYSVTVLYDKTLHAIDANQEYNIFVEFLSDDVFYCGTCVSGIYGPKFLTVKDDNTVSADADNVGEREKFKLIATIDEI